MSHCPVCKTEISRDRLNDKVVICQSCGHVNSESNKISEKRANKQISTFFVGFALVAVVSMVHVINWSNHSASIIPLKAKQYTATASIADLEKVAEICVERKKPSCVEQAYADATNMNPNNLDALQKYGKILSQNNKTDKAQEVYSEYFRKKGTELSAYYEFAKVLGQQGEIEQASNYYEYVINSKPGTLQITVTQSYVNMLFNNGHLKAAKKVINDFRNRGDNAKFFMQERMQQINAQLASL